MPRPVPTESKEFPVGMECWLTDEPPIGGKLRVAVEDFRVEEVGGAPPPGPGKHVAVQVRLTNWENNLFLRKAIKTLDIHRGATGFCGIKDKRAITTQWFTFGVPLGKERRLAQIGGVEILQSYATPKPLRLGAHEGNRFRIVIRQVPGDAAQVERKVARVAAELWAHKAFPNFFGIQRFGSIRPITQAVGRALVLHDPEAAVRTYLTLPVSEERSEVFEARQRLAEEGDYAAALEYFPTRLKFERSVIGHLSRNPGDWARAMRALPKNLLILFVHAYQAVVFNRVLSRRLAAGLPLSEAVEGDLVVPLEGALASPTDEEPVRVTRANLNLVNEQLAKGRGAVSALVPGFEVPLAQGGPGDIERKVLEEEGLTSNDFFVEELPEASSRGMRRSIRVPLVDWEWSVVPDEVTSEGTSRIETAFSLPKGCYATSLLREIVKGETSQY